MSPEQFNALQVQYADIQKQLAINRFTICKMWNAMHCSSYSWAKKQRIGDIMMTIDKCILIKNIQSANNNLDLLESILEVE